MRRIKNPCNSGNICNFGSKYGKILILFEKKQKKLKTNKMGDGLYTGYP